MLLLLLLLLQQLGLWKKQARGGGQVRVRRPGSALVVVVLGAAEAEIKKVVRTSGAGGRERAHDGVVRPVDEEAVAAELAPERVVALWGIRTFGQRTGRVFGHILGRFVSSDEVSGRDK